MEWDCAVSRASDHSRKILKTGLLELKTYLEQTRTGYNPSFLETSNGSEVIVNSFPRRQKSSSEQENQWLNAILEAKTDSKKFLKGETSIIDLASKLVMKLESALTSKLEDREENSLPNDAMDLAIMEVSPNPSQSWMKITVKYFFQAQLRHIGWQVARLYQVMQEIKLSILCGPDHLTPTMLDEEETQHLIEGTNVLLGPFDRKMAVTSSTAYNSP